ncbi:MAG: transcriptional regulator, MarR family [Rhizobacter sp.]|nr:transcriptional regulator, MarR family [Rhizobacter sp.]
MVDPERTASLMAIAMALPVLQRSYKAVADKAVAHVGLSQSLAWPLVMLGRLGGNVRHGVLAEALGIEAPSLARSLDQLVAGGLAERQDDPHDRRAKTLHLTAAGLAAREQIEASLRAMREDAFDGITDRDLKACLRVFERMGSRLGCTMPAIPPIESDGVEADTAR